MSAIPPPDFGNYLETSNPFGLARPPVFFLRDMLVQDADLVIFPSMQECVYRLCRRVKHGPPPAMTIAVDPFRNPDTAFMRKHQIIGVTGIVPFPHWGPQLLEDLARMDMWRMGGADGMADALEKLEEEKRDRLDALLVDEAGQRSVSAWDALKLRQGSTTFVRGYSAPKP